MGCCLFCRNASSPTPSALLVKSLSEDLSVVWWGCPGTGVVATRSCWHWSVLLRSCRASIPSAVRVAGCCTPWRPHCKPHCSHAWPYIGNYLGSLCTVFGTEQLQGEADIWAAAGGILLLPLTAAVLGLGFLYRDTLPPPAGMLRACFPAAHCSFRAQPPRLTRDIN